MGELATNALLRAAGCRASSRLQTQLLRFRYRYAGIECRKPSRGSFAGCMDGAALAALLGLLAFRTCADHFALVIETLVSPASTSAASPVRPPA